MKDLVEAVTWFRKAVESDHPGSQYMLAMCHLNGDGGVPYDIAKSESLLLRAAQQGHLDAMYELGIVYRGDHDRSESKAVQRLRDLVGEHSSSPRIDKYTDLNKSESWFRLGASHGHSGCQYECGMLSRQNKASADA